MLPFLGARDLDDPAVRYQLWRLTVEKGWVLEWAGDSRAAFLERISAYTVCFGHDRIKCAAEGGWLP